VLVQTLILKSLPKCLTEVVCFVSVNNLSNVLSFLEKKLNFYCHLIK